MTATDELHRLLDERGVEWIGTSFSTPAKGHPANTSLGEEHHEATFIEYDDGNVLRLFDLTPAQAVEATLGRGTCRDTGEDDVRIDELEDENAKLRELVRDMWNWLAPTAVGGGAPLKWLHNRMRELGVEV